jgi:glycosyltransferase involved in cell wall biosynthesis
MRVQIVDPPAWTPPYDHALCAALTRAGAEVELLTTHFPFGPIPVGNGYRVSESFYRRSARLYRTESAFLSAPPGGPSDTLRRAIKLAEHVPDMLRYRRRARRADVVHYQWLAFEQVDRYLLPPARPRVLTAHDVLPREPRPGQRAATRRLLERMDAVVVHSEHGARRLREELGIPPDRVHPIPHGVFDHLTRLPDELPLPPELEAVEGPVVLFFGLLRPYKGIEVLLRAFAEVEGAELWVVGMPRMSLEPLRELSARAGGRVRFVPRFIPDPEIPAYFRRADLVVLPYLEIDQSGVLYTALAFEKPLLLSSVGGFSEVAERHDAARLVPPGDAGALAATLNELLGDSSARRALAEASARAAAEAYSWDAVARTTLALYRKLLDA